MKKLSLAFMAIACFGQAPTWTNPSASIGISPPYWVAWNGINYSPFSRLTLVHGNDNASSIYVNSTYSVNMSTFAKTKLYTSTGASTPPSWCNMGLPYSGTSIPNDRHPESQRWYDSVRNRLWQSGGTCQDNTGTYVPFDLFYFQFSDNTWHNVSSSTNHYPNSNGQTGCSAGPATCTGNSFDTAAVVHDTDDDVFFWYGNDRNAHSHNNWVYCPTSTNPTPGTLTARQTLVGCLNPDDFSEITISGGWTTGTNQPDAIFNPGMVYDTLHHKVIAFGGLDSNETVSYNDVWVFDLAPTLTVTNTVVAGYTVSSATQCTTAGWCKVLSPGGTAGTNCAPSSPFPPCMPNTITNTPLAYDYNNGLVYYHYNDNTPGSGGANHDYAYDYLQNQWRDLGANSGPSACPALAYDGLTNSLVCWNETNSSDPSIWKGALPAIVSGMGSSTTTCVDLDGDGYGTGSGCTGPDADDQDVTVNTTATALSKYGTLTAYVNHLGYFPANIWYISTSGNDGTGVKNNASLPFATCQGALTAGAAAGDMLMLRAGTWTTGCNVITGTTGNPFIVLAYPGEIPILSGASSGFSSLLNISWFIVDGINFVGPASCIGNATSAGSYTMTGLPTFVHNAFRHMDASGCEWQFHAINGLVDMVVEYNYFHDPGGPQVQHDIYIGATDVPNKNVTVRRNVLGNVGVNAFTNMQHNGRVTNLVVEQNLLYGGHTAALSFEEGVSYSFIRLNLFANFDQSGVAKYEYDGNGAINCPAAPESGAVCPYDQNYDLFENNTFYGTGKNQDGTLSGYQPALQLANDSTFFSPDLGHDTWRNNLFVVAGANNTVPPITYRSTTAAQTCGADCLGWYSTSIFDHTTFMQNDGNNGAGIIGVGGGGGAFNPFNCAGAATYTTMTNCSNANPLFTAASPSYWNSPSSYNFALSGGSPAVSGGSVVGIPLSDNKGTLFMLASPLPSLGALQGSASASSGGSVLGGSLKLGGSATIH